MTATNICWQGAIFIEILQVTTLSGMLSTYRKDPWRRKSRLQMDWKDFLADRTRESLESQREYCVFTDRHLLNRRFLRSCRDLLVIFDTISAFYIREKSLSEAGWAETEHHEVNGLAKDDEERGDNEEGIPGNIRLLIPPINWPLLLPGAVDVWIECVDAEHDGRRSLNFMIIVGWKVNCLCDRKWGDHSTNRHCYSVFSLLLKYLKKNNRSW